MLVEKIYKETASISLTSQHPSFLFLQIPSSTMNFGAEPSHLPSSDDDDESFSHYLEELDEETTQWQKKDEIFASVYASNKEIMAYLSKEDERPKRIGSVLGHLVINRGRKVTIDSSMTIFLITPHMVQIYSVEDFKCKGVYSFVLSTEYESTTTSYIRWMVPVSLACLLYKK